ncbi:MAG: hypothetical protein KDB07_01980 [Planctomycetes bacterium]|nr:hypothetical protein [Planctomycetota bacterium]
MAMFSLQCFGALALFASMTATLGACSLSHDLGEKRVDNESAYNARIYHGSEKAVHANQLFDELLDTGDEREALASIQSQKVHLSRLHRASIIEHRHGRVRPTQDAEGNDIEKPATYPVLKGWIAEMSSVRRGLVEIIFYDNDWAQLATLTPDGFLTIGNGNAKRKLGHRLSVSLAAEVVYGARTRHNLNSWEDDVVLISTYSGDDALPGNVGVSSNRVEARVSGGERRVVLTSADHDNFRGLIPNR